MKTQRKDRSINADCVKLRDFPKLDVLVKWHVTKAMNTLRDRFELESDVVDAVECDSRDGFSTSQDGGYEGRGFTTVGSLMDHNLADKRVTDQIEKYYTMGMVSALDIFKDEHKAELEGVSEDKIGYHGLQELGLTDLAEKLSEIEFENVNDELSTVMLQVGCYFYHADSFGDGETKAYLYGVVNYEAPYHRSGKDRETVVYKKDISFKDVAELKQVLDAEIKELLTKF